MNTQKIKMNLPLILPDLNEGSHDRCIDRLKYALLSQKGIEQVHLNRTETAGGELCIHYDSDLIHLDRVGEIVRSNGAAITNQFGHIRQKLRSPLKPRAALRLEKALRKIPAVVEANVAPTGVLRVEYSRNEIAEADLKNEIELAIQGLSDFSVSRKSPSDVDGSKDEQGHKHNGKEEGHTHEGGILGERTELFFSIASGLLLGLGWTLERFAIDATVIRVLYILAYFAGGFFVVREALENLRNRKLEIDSLMVLAAIGAAVLGELPEGALLLFLFSFGHALEHFDMGKARKAIEALQELAPDTARVERNGTVIEVRVSDLNLNDVIVIRPNERIAADGFVIEGESAVDQAAVTGESIPVDKFALPQGALESHRTDSRYRLFAGTINGSGSLRAQVTRLSKDSTLSRVIEMVNDAEARKSPTQLFTDKFERIFVPAVLAFIAILPFAFLIINETWQVSLYRAMSVLVAASPCALAIATPSAVLSSVARAARGGVLIKGGAPLEELGTLTAIAFDKTGTLTEGRPEVTDVKLVNGVTERELMAYAIAIEKQSDHPLASAIVLYGTKNGQSNDASLTAQNVKSVTGKGIVGDVNGHEVEIGKRSLFEGSIDGNSAIHSLTTSLEEGGRTVMIMRVNGQFLGVIGLMDKPRETAKKVIADLARLGVRKMVMLSGDHQKVAESVASELGLSEAKGDLMPEDKVAAIRNLRKSEKIAMVGDGVNDAPAMTQATVAIAMGAAGSDVALQTADIALMSDDLRALPFAVGLSRQGRRIVKQNLFISLGMVAVLIPATLFGLGMGLAVVGHEGSTLVVVLNALRLLAYKDFKLAPYAVDGAD